MLQAGTSVFWELTLISTSMVGKKCVITWNPKWVCDERNGQQDMLDASRRNLLCIYVESNYKCSPLFTSHLPIIFEKLQK